MDGQLSPSPSFASPPSQASPEPKRKRKPSNPLDQIEVVSKHNNNTSFKHSPPNVCVHSTPCPASTAPACPGWGSGCPWPRPAARRRSWLATRWVGRLLATTSRQRGGPWVDESLWWVNARYSAVGPRPMMVRPLICGPRGGQGQTLGSGSPVLSGLHAPWVLCGSMYT